MGLSPRAEKLISLAERVPRPTEREEVAQYLEAAGISGGERFLRFQEKYGGLQLFAAGMQELVELGMLLDPGDGTYQIAGVDDEGEWILTIGRFENSGNMLMMDQDGILYADTVPIADSIETWLETHAVAAEMQLTTPDWYSTAFMTVHRDDRAFDAAMDLPRIAEACDDYTTWWGTESMRFERTVFWEPKNQTHVIRGFAKDEAEVPMVLSYFDRVYDSVPPVIWWPYRMVDGQVAKP